MLHGLPESAYRMVEAPFWSWNYLLACRLNGSCECLDLPKERTQGAELNRLRTEFEF